jgi:pyruvate/2-oxoglutarate/acetoin dehydrogenase E1 component
MTTVLESLNRALHSAMAADARVVVLGEDILDPYGGAFKVTRGLSTQYPERVLTTPISEAGIVGVAAGMGMRGLRPVVEIMFGDFLTLCADQIINHSAKFRWMYNDQVRVPIVIRTPMGGRRGYGPTHSQSLEKIYLGIPGIKVVAPNAVSDPGELLLAAIQDEDPMLFIEHKLLYNMSILTAGQGSLADYDLESGEQPYPYSILHPKNRARVTLATYGYNFELARTAADQLMMEHEIFCEIIVTSLLAPCGMEAIRKSLETTGNLVTVEEGTADLGWGAEILARVLENGGKVRAKRVAARNLPVANARVLEDAVLPSVQDIVDAALCLVGEKS